MMNKRQYAAFMCAKDTLTEIQELTNNLKVTNAYKTAQQIQALADKWMKDFATCDPKWTPPLPAVAVEEAND